MIEEVFQAKLIEILKSKTSFKTKLNLIKRLLFDLDRGSSKH